ncbi:MAG: Zn-dependent hydrolase [Acidobacteria bacterium]|nr:Zn-dependent hydrolase [Acidobacteriota bacterium]
MPVSLRVNAARLQHHLDELARIGAPASGGVCRLAFSVADKQGRDYVEARMRSLGLAVRIDRIGNLLGVRRGADAGRLVLAGSHLDTVGTAGRFDGSVGVLGALEVIETLNDARVSTGPPIGVIAFANEEGARFAPDMMGSLVFRGDLRIEDARSRVDRDGMSVGEAIDLTGYAGPDNLDDVAVRAYLELHIEQGPILEHAHTTIGVVEAVQGLTWITFTLTGATAHAGATPIDMRRDAGYVAAAIVQYARTLSHDIEGQRATVGALSLAPNIVNVVPERARLTVDLRNPDADRLAMAEQRLQQFVADRAAAERVTVSYVTDVRVPPVQFDTAVVTHVQDAATALGYSSMRMVSGAGHDAQILSRKFPAAMIFVPSRGGISHNVDEFTSTSDLEAGANVLLHTVLALAV